MVDNVYLKKVDLILFETFFKDCKEIVKIIMIINLIEIVEILTIIGVEEVRVNY